jgi:hypothetical protein
MFETITDVTEKAGSTATKTLDLVENTLDLLNNELLEIKKTQLIRQEVLNDDKLKKQIQENMRLELELKLARKKARLEKLSNKYK